MITIHIDKDDSGYSNDYRCWDDSYDGAPDSNCAVGHGATAREALESYIESNCDKDREWTE